MQRRSIKRRLLVLICTIILVTESGSAQESRLALYDLPDFQARILDHIDPDNLNVDLLADCIIFQTNGARRKHSLKECRADGKLTAAAAAHSREMAKLQYFSHESPVKKNKTLDHRLKNAGIFLPGTTFGENLGVDFILALSEVPYYTETHRGRIHYYDFHTKKKIKAQTYRDFAVNMVKNWLASPGHRANLLNGKYTKIGIGIARGRYKGHDALYVTQNFQGPITPASTGRDPQSIHRQRQGFR